MPGAVYLRGETVTLRTIEAEDVDFLHEMINDPALWQGFGAPGPRSKRAVEDGFDEQHSGVALLVCRDAEPIGRVRLVDVDKDWGNAELTCYVAPEHQRQGVASEACELVIDYGFDYLPIDKVTARVFDSNRSSRHLVDALGFVHEGTLREHVFHGGQYLDLHCYGLLADDWRSRE